MAWGSGIGEEAAGSVMVEDRKRRMGRYAWVALRVCDIADYDSILAEDGGWRDGCVSWKTRE